MTAETKLIIVSRALRIACKWIRKNPPGDLDLYDIEQIRALTNAEKDPDGENFLQYFLMKAMEEIKEKKEKSR